MIDNVLSINTRVRTPNGLVMLDELSGSGPAGPAGPAGPQGETGTVDTSLYYKLQVEFAIISSKPSAGLSD